MAVRHWGHWTQWIAIEHQSRLSLLNSQAILHLKFSLQFCLRGFFCELDLFIVTSIILGDTSKNESVSNTQDVEKPEQIQALERGEESRRDPV